MKTGRSEKLDRAGPVRYRSAGPVPSLIGTCSIVFEIVSESAISIFFGIGIGIGIADSDSDPESPTAWLKSNYKYSHGPLNWMCLMLKRASSVFFRCLSNHCLYTFLNAWFNWLLKVKEKQYIVFHENASDSKFFASMNRNRIGLGSIIFGIVSESAVSIIFGIGIGIGIADSDPESPIPSQYTF